MAQIYLGTSYSEIFEKDINKPNIVKKWGSIGDKEKVKAIEYCKSHTPTTLEEIFKVITIKQQEDSEEQNQTNRLRQQFLGRNLETVNRKPKHEQKLKSLQNKTHPEFIYASTKGLNCVQNQNNVMRIADYESEPAGLHLYGPSFVSVLRNGKVLLTYCQKGQENYTSATIYQYKNANKINLAKGQGFLKTASFSDNSKICMVGKNVLPIVYSITSQVVTWQGKNVPNDQLDLQVPIHDNDVSLFQENLIVTLHQFKKVRLYDIKNNKKRPIIDAQVKTPYNQQTISIEKSQCQNYIYVASNQGNIYQCDRRKSFAVSGKFKDTPNASISSMLVQGTHLIACGLDGNLRVFDCGSKTMQRKIFVNRAVFSMKLKSDMFELRDLQNNQEEQVQKTDKDGNKVKKIRKRNKVGLPYLRVKKQQKQKQENQEQL